MTRRLKPNRMPPMMPRAAAMALLALGPVMLALMPAPACAQSADPAAVPVAALDAALIALMRSGGGMAERERQVAPVIDRAFNLPFIIRYSIGPAWTGIAPRDQAALTTAFRAMTIAQYVHNFGSFSGQRFVLAPQVEVRGTDRLVRTTLLSPGEAAEQILYRMREDGAPGSGQWKIIDVFYRNGISQLATRRSDFAEVMRHGGAPALIAHLGRLAANPK